MSDHGHAVSSASVADEGNSGVKLIPSGANGPKEHRRASTLLASIMIVASCVIVPHGRPFVFDAGTYWGSARQLLHLDMHMTNLHLRGVFTAVMYLPAVVAAQILKSVPPAIFVELQNGLLLVLLCVGVIPRLIGAWARPTAMTTWTASILGSLLLSRFSPYPLTDLWGGTLILLAVVMLARGNRLAGFVAGLAGSSAFNVRPAYLACLVLLTAGIFIVRGRSGIFFLLGGFAGLLPQVLVNLVMDGRWYPWPKEMSSIAGLQAGYGAYVVRYDTVAYAPAPDPRLFHCSPDMAALVGPSPPASVPELLRFFGSHLPEAAVFLGQKMAAAFYWPAATPYFGPARKSDVLVAASVIFVTTCGVGALLRRLPLRSVPGDRIVGLGVLSVLLGSMTTLLTSTPETRFALPVLVLGITGCALVTTEWARDRRLPLSVPVLLLVVSSSVAVLAAAPVSLEHPMSGAATSERCSHS